jgi:hypothetical protein
MPQKYRGAHDVAPTGGTIGIGTGRTDGAGIGGTCGGGLAVTQSFGRETDDGKPTRFWIESFCAIVSRSGSQRPSRVVSSTSTAVCVDRYTRRPSGLTTTSRGWVGVAIVATTAPRCASMTVSVRAIWLAT